MDNSVSPLAEWHKLQCRYIAIDRSIIYIKAANSRAIWSRSFCCFICLVVYVAARWTDPTRPFRPRPRVVLSAAATSMSHTDVLRITWSQHPILRHVLQLQSEETEAIDRSPRRQPSTKPGYDKGNLQVSRRCFKGHRKWDALSLTWIVPDSVEWILCPQGRWSAD